MLAHQAEDDLRRDTILGRNIVSSSDSLRKQNKSSCWLLFLYL